jgi:hypothetical protein
MNEPTPEGVEPQAWQRALAAADAFPPITPHPLVPWYSRREMASMLLHPDGFEQLARLAPERERLIQASLPEGGDPYRHGFELSHWKDADQLRETMIYFLIILGGNRSAKTEYCGKRLVQDVVRVPRTLAVCLSEDIDASIKNQQSLVWKYLPVELKRLRGVRDRNRVFKINYSDQDGFTDRIVTLPNRSQIYFKTYNEKPEEVEGWMFGADNQLVIGGWADENLRTNWLNMFHRRFRFRPAQMLWSYTPIKGMTDAIRLAVGDEPRVLESRPAELLAETENVPGCPRGHMPYITASRMEKSRTIYFHSILNPFGTLVKTPEGGARYRSYYEGVKESCVGKSRAWTMRIAYGYTKDAIARPIPNFGWWNIIPQNRLPKLRTNYHYLDPAGARNYAMLWAAVAPGNPAAYYIYRDWPDEPNYGEWAVPTERALAPDSRLGWDGDPGPAQNSLGWGITRYKQEILDLETVKFPNDPDPYRAALWAAVQALPLEERPLAREAVLERAIDSRAAETPLAEREGTTNLLQLFEQEDRDATGTIVAPGLTLRQTSGARRQTGLNILNGWIDDDGRFDKGSDIVPVHNCPRFFVAENCKQVIWALENYTGKGGEDGACKDFIDLLIYLALDQPTYCSPGTMGFTRKGGAY